MVVIHTRVGTSSVDETIRHSATIGVNGRPLNCTIEFRFKSLTCVCYPRCLLGCSGGRKNRQRQKRRESDQGKESNLSVEYSKPVHLNDRKVSTVDEIPESLLTPKTTHEHMTESQESAELLQEKKEEVIPDKTGQSFSEKSEISDDEIEEDELYSGESDLDDEEQEFYSDEAFSEDKLHTQTKADAKLRRSNESVGDGNHYSREVLNPVENLTHWKSAKSSGKTVQKLSEKENSNNLISDQEDKRIPFLSAQTLRLMIQRSTPQLSPRKLKTKNYSKRVINSRADRPILCALTSEDIKQFSAASMPRKSPRKSPNETPIIGTVGDSGFASSFKGITNTTSKYKEDKSVNWHSTPSEARLEKALNRDK
ncbi:hypothetical protein Bca52824_022791 [Brassica carinata]|uniref:Uncharacterized protein n=1 Tax=Brassica carinata TaxID=52824 RepID=A0A8X7VGZ7_BRACI|nr:hypothetical protein Bca52824_022791 [Brassica carinata]